MNKAIKAKFFREEVKDRHTNHWDLDLVSRAELERLMSPSEQRTENETAINIERIDLEREPNGSE